MRNAKKKCLVFVCLLLAKISFLFVAAVMVLMLTLPAASAQFPSHGFDRLFGVLLLVADLKTTETIVTKRNSLGHRLLV